MKRTALLIRGFLYISAAGLCLFWSAGRWDLPWFWAYLGMLAAVFAIWPFFMTSELIKERLRPGGRKPGVALRLLIVPALAHWVVAGLDVGRYRWSAALPGGVQAAALVVLVGSLALSIWAMQVNPFFSSVVRIQTERGHTVISAGPYAFIRHPGYAAGLLCVAASGLALGSLVSTVPYLALAPFLLYRTVVEDRTLKRGLPGYAEYAGRVRFRLLPGLW